MPTFYFDIRGDGSFFEDEEGSEHLDVDSAEREAAEVAAAIGRERLPEQRAGSVIVEVRNEHGSRVLTATVSIHVDRREPPG